MTFSVHSKKLLWACQCCGRIKIFANPTLKSSPSVLENTEFLESFCWKKTHFFQLFYISWSNLWLPLIYHVKCNSSLWLPKQCSSIYILLWLSMYNFLYNSSHSFCSYVLGIQCTAKIKLPILINRAWLGPIDIGVNWVDFNQSCNVFFWPDNWALMRP